MRTSDLFNLYKFPLGRSVFALSDVERRARAAGQHEIASLAMASILEGKRNMALGLRFDAGRTSVYPPEALALGQLMDRVIGGLAKYLEAQMRIYPDEPRAGSADTLMRELLPDGVSGLTHLPYAEEHTHLTTLLERTADPDLAPHVQALPEMSDMLDRLRQLNHEYGAVLLSASEAPTRQVLDQGKAHCQELLAGVVALIIGAYTRADPVQQAAVAKERDQLLEPIMAQQEAIRLLRQRRRALSDVNPQTGEELPGEESPNPADSDDTTSTDAPVLTTADQP